MTETKRITLRLNKTVNYLLLVEKAQKNGRSINSEIIQAIKEHLKTKSNVHTRAKETNYRVEEV